VCALCLCGVATISRLLKIIGLFCKRALYKRLYPAKETYDFKEPTNRSHPIPQPSRANPVQCYSTHQEKSDTSSAAVSGTATRCNTQQRTAKYSATQCNTMQLTATEGLGMREWVRQRDTAPAGHRSKVRC